MGVVVVADGKVVYGDAQELRVVQLAGVKEELDRLTADMIRLHDALNAAKATLDTMSLSVSAARVPSRVRTSMSPPPPQPTPVPQQGPQTFVGTSTAAQVSTLPTVVHEPTSVQVHPVQLAASPQVPTVQQTTQQEKEEKERAEQSQRDKRQDMHRDRH